MIAWLAVLIVKGSGKYKYETVKLPRGGIHGLANSLETSRRNANGNKILGFKLDSSKINYSHIVYNVAHALITGEEAPKSENDHPNLKALEKLGVSFQWEKYGLTRDDGDKIVGQLSSNVATVIPMLVIWVLFTVVMIILLFLPCCVEEVSCSIIALLISFFIGIAMLIVGASILIAGIVKVSEVIGDYSEMDEVVGEAMIQSFGDLVIVLTKELPLILDPIISVVQNLLNTLDKSITHACQGLRVMIADLISLLIGTGPESSKLLGIWALSHTLDATRVGIWRNFLAAQPQVTEINQKAQDAGINDLLIDFSFFSDLVDGTEYVTSELDYYLATLESGQTIQWLISQLDKGKEFAHDASTTVVENEKTIKDLFADFVHEYVEWHLPFTEEADDVRNIVLGVGIFAVILIICSFVVFIIVFCTEGDCCQKTTITSALWGIVIGVFVLVASSVTTILGTVLVQTSEDVEPVADLAMNTVLDLALDNRTFEAGVNLTDKTGGFVDGKLRFIVPFQDDHDIFRKMTTVDPKLTTLESLVGLSEFINLRFIAETIRDDIIEIGEKLKMPPRFEEPYQDMLNEFRNVTLFPVTETVTKIFSIPIQSFSENEISKVVDEQKRTELEQLVKKLEDSLNQYSKDYDDNVKKLVNEDIPNNIDTTVNNLIQDVKDAVKDMAPIGHDLLLQLDWIPGNFSTESVVNIYARVRNDIFYDLTNGCFLFWIGSLFTYFGYLLTVGALFFRAKQDNSAYIVQI